MPSARNFGSLVDMHCALSSGSSVAEYEYHFVPFDADFGAMSRSAADKVLRKHSYRQVTYLHLSLGCKGHAFDFPQQPSFTFDCASSFLTSVFPLQGLFLVRKSATDPKDFGLSVCSHSTVRRPRLLTLTRKTHRAQKATATKQQFTRKPQYPSLRSTTIKRSSTPA